MESTTVEVNYVNHAGYENASELVHHGTDDQTTSSSNYTAMGKKAANNGSAVTCSEYMIPLCPTLGTNDSRFENRGRK